MKAKQWYIAAAVGIAAVLIGLGVWMFVANKKQVPKLPVADETQQVLTLSADSIGLTVAFRSDNKAMKFTISDASGINSVEYQISYNKIVNGEQVPEGLIGTVDMNPGDKTAGIGFREFGTCSSGVCRYDNALSPVTLTLKIVKSDGKVYQVVKTADIPQ